MVLYPELIADAGPVLTDGGIETRIMFGTGIEMDPEIQVAGLLGDPEGRSALGEIYDGYIAAAAERRLPVVIGTPTFRASPNFVRRAGLQSSGVEELNGRAVEFHLENRLRSGYEPVYIAGVIGPSGDAYRPEEALSPDAAARYHRPQADTLSEAGADFLFAATFPSVDEAEGACVAMAATGLPHVISWILGPDTKVLDGSSLAGAIARLDSNAKARPLYHSLSCIHPTAGRRAVATLTTEAPELLPRLVEFKANGSPLRTDELVRLNHPTADPPGTFADEMAVLFDREGLRVLGGCCGTDDSHMRALGRLLAELGADVPESGTVDAI